MPGGGVGRNDPCPCGSGKKYKKCCVGKYDGVEAPRAHAHDPSGAHARMGSVAIPAGLSPRDAAAFVERLDAWGNAARAALEAGRFDEVERRCDRLVAEYPHQIDGYEIRARMREAQGRWAEAADLYEKSLAVAHEDPEGFDRELHDELWQSAQKARQRAAGPGSSR